MVKVGVIGLGKMGTPIAKRLLMSGHDLHVFSRSSGAVKALAEAGAHPCQSIVELVREVDTAVTSLPTVDSVMSVYTEIAEAARPGQLFADHSTVSPAASRECAALLFARGADYLDAPVSGGPAGATAGSLTIMVGGEQSVYARLLPVFGSYGKNIRLCGPVGSGGAIKLVNQLLVGIHTAATAEAVTFGLKLGADPSVLEEVIGTSFGASAMFSRNAPRLRMRDFAPATTINLLVKDLDIVGDEASAHQASVPLGSLVTQYFHRAVELDLGELDMAAVGLLWA